MTSDIIPTTITQPQLAILLGLTTRQVRRLTGTVFRVTGKKGNLLFYPLPESIHTFIAYRERMVRKRCLQSGKESMDHPEYLPP